mmetsp:Transcript_49688/g.166000  ORF Transcript_49688/g.166000 Transcript_49688/m.166000 type:complete len:103 (+) Transcript_49688:141-449(+)
MNSLPCPQTAKNRMAFQTPDPATGKLPFTGTMQTIGAAARSSINRSTSSRPSMISFLGAVARSSGPLSLWSGFLPYYGRCGGHTVTMFVFVDQLRILYRQMQ